MKLRPDLPDTPPFGANLCGADLRGADRKSTNLRGGRLALGYIERSRDRLRQSAWADLSGLASAASGPSLMGQAGGNGRATSRRLGPVVS